MVAYQFHRLRVAGSNPASDTKIFCIIRFKEDKGKEEKVSAHSSVG